MPGDAQPSTDERLAGRVADALAAPPAERPRALLRLARSAAGRVADVVAELERRGSRRLAAEFLAHCESPWPPLAAWLAATLCDEGVPPAVKLPLAGRWLDQLADIPAAVRPVLKALTHGLTPARALERLIQLERHVEHCGTLGVLVEEAEARTRVRCPVCRSEVPRFRLASHLWHVHSMLADGAKAAEPRAALESLVESAAGAADPGVIDSAFAATEAYYPDESPDRVLQALTLRGAADRGARGRLLESAAGQGAGLCPVCLTALPDPWPPLPPPANRAGGRVSAEGFAVTVRDALGGRSTVVTRPGGRSEEDTVTASRLSPRVVASLAALPALALGLAAVALFPARRVSPLVTAALALIASAAVYLIARALRRPPRPADDVALGLAWSDLAPGVGRSLPAVRFLTRLCRASLGHGDALGRSAALHELVNQSAVLADKSPENLQLFAAARLLQATDAAALGRERVAALEATLAPAVRGELPLAFAETVAAALAEAAVLKPGERERLAVLLLDHAFAAGFRPADLPRLADTAPQLAALLTPTDAAQVAALYAVWRRRGRPDWEEIGPALALFDFARSSPVDCRRTLAAHPDALLIVAFPQREAESLGPVALTAGGLAIAGAVVGDPQARIEYLAGGTLQFGPHRLALGRALPASVVAALKAWLRYRVQLVRQAAAEPDGPPSPALLAALRPAAVTCPLCAAESLVRAGRVGTPWGELSGGAP